MDPNSIRIVFDADVSPESARAITMNVVRTLTDAGNLVIEQREPCGRNAVLAYGRMASYSFSDLIKGRKT